MRTTEVAAVRRFNRFYTKQIGVLDEGLLHTRFTLAEARVLYEIANGDNVSAGQLSDQLQLDPGYLSRILQRFHKLRLLRRKVADDDARRSVLTLSTKGRQAFATLNQRQNKDVAALLKRVPSSRRPRLIASMRTIEDALGAAPATAFVLRQPKPGDMGWIVYRHGALYSTEYGYDERFEALVARIVSDFVLHLDPKRERCWIAERDGEIVGSIFLVEKSRTIARLRLLYVEPSARGLGIGKRLVDECIAFARQAGYRKITLWTQSELGAARHLYKQAGFKLIGRKRHRDFSRRTLVAETWELDLL